MVKSGFAALAVFCVAGLITASRLYSQDRVDLTSQNVTSERLVGVLTPKIPARGIYLKDAKVKCRQYRGVKLVTPAADIAAIKIEFASGSAELTPAGEKTLSTLGKALQSEQLQPCCFQIGGYTDSIGRLSSNEKLSQRRARSVVEYLTADAGIDSERMMPQGYGPKNPIGDNNTPEGRARNRRVEVMNRGYGTSSE
jgi:outer membrane protein OmpA-like peptidoglycan-associated protein